MTLFTALQSGPLFLGEPIVGHTFLGQEGPLGILLEVAAFLVLILHIAALVILSETDLPAGAKAGWAAFILLVPVIGPTAYLLRHWKHHGARRGDTDRDTPTG